MARNVLKLVRAVRRRRCRRLPLACDIERNAVYLAP
jgi:hypothetical protein